MSNDDPFWIPDEKPAPKVEVKNDDPFWLPPDWKPPYDPRVEVHDNYVIIASKHRIERENTVRPKDWRIMWDCYAKRLKERGSWAESQERIREQMLEPMRVFRRLAGIAEPGDN
jgi:hypothetical protein